MTRPGHRLRGDARAAWRTLRLQVGLCALVACRCVCGTAAIGIGDRCEDSTACADGLVCVLVDEARPDDQAVCMPPLYFDKTACSSDVDCHAEGMPIDAWCTDDGYCTCEDLVDTTHPACSGEEVLGRFACACVPRAELPVGEECDHPEECLTGICDGSHCLAQCEAHDQCGGLTTTCNDDGVCE